MDAGIWRRLIVIPFGAKITGSSDRKNYADYLLKSAGPYIMSWIIEGAEKAVRNNFTIPLPECVEQAIQAYREDNDWLGHFLNECCEVGDGLTAKSGGFYDAYRAYCSRTGEYVRNSAEFYAAVEQRGFTRIKKKNGRFIGGVRLVVRDFTD